MTTGVLLPLLLNILVGVWLVWFYPRSVQRNFRGGVVPPAFRIMARVMPILGILIIVGSIAYAIYSLYGSP